MPATPHPARPARLAPLALLCAALLCGCVSTTPRDVRTTDPAGVTARATPTWSPDGEDGRPVEHYGVAETGPDDTDSSRPAPSSAAAPSPGTPHPSTPGPNTPRPHAPQPHTPQAHEPQAHKPQAHDPQPHAPQAHHSGGQPGPRTGGRPVGKVSVCDLGTRYGRWPAGSSEERTCHRIYG
ncbi:hypothetical protein [Peterkaempfera bronchialis]|uniref:hypothetical protein n=1 Tax=Peterkaempfera bronchialis TaxID=2126346 RepID=UPI003C2BDD44